MKQEIIKLLQDLISITTTSEEPEKLESIVTLIDAYFSDVSLHTQQYEHNGKPSIVITTHETLHPKVMLNGHLDVVPGTEDMFKPRIEGEQLFGRGAFDMKGYVAMMMVVMKEFVSASNGDSVGLMLTTDEEVGGFNGVRYLLEDLGYSADVAYIPDGGENFSIVTDEKGVLHVKVTASGIAAHGSRPWLGDNAIDRLIGFYQDVRDDFPHPTSEDDWRHSLTLGQISGGDTVNKVADHAQMYLDFRLVHPETIASMTQKLESRADEYKVVLEVISTGDIAHTDKDNPFMQTYLEVMKNHGIEKTAFVKTAGASDGRFFSAKGIPVITTRGRGDGQHTDNEWVHIGDLEKQGEMLRDFLREVQKER